MKKSAILAITLGGVLLVCCPAAFSQSLRLEGQVSSWFVLNNERPSTPGLGLRYLPTLSLEQKLPDGRSIDGEVSINAYGFGQSAGWSGFRGTGRLKPYRVWGRFKTSGFEARVGLQQINFGSATLLRPLRWFDSVDPRDPLQITDGVYGLLVRDYLPHDFTVWAWGLYGNEHPKGWELNPTGARTPEFGGRFQAPVFKGEMAFTTHHRRADLSKGLTSDSDLQDPISRESRYGLDGKWDVGIGIWFEGTLIHQIHSILPAADERALTLGADYTFNIGNGLHILGEYFVQERARVFPGQANSTTLSAASLTYPVGLLDSVSGILYFDTGREEAYRFVSWQRTYDRWRFYFMAFWNPRQSAIYQDQSGQTAGGSPLAGKGFQVMAVFNHRKVQHGAARDPSDQDRRAGQGLFNRSLPARRPQ